MQLMKKAAMKRVQRCSLDAGHRKLFRRQAMQRDITQEGHTSKQ